MNAEQNSRFDAWERTIKVCDENPKEVALNAFFQADKDLLASLLPNIRHLSKLANAENAHAEIKLKAKNTMIAAGLDVCKVLSGYALITKDADFKKMGKQSKSSLGEGKEEQIIERNGNIADKIRTLSPELMAKRGMPESLLTHYETAIDVYKNVKTDPRSAIQNRTALLTELDAAVAEGDDAFTLLKASALNLKGVADSFLTRFDTACGIIAPKTSPTKTVFEVINGETQERITNYVINSAAMKLTNHKVAASTLMKKSHKAADITISCDGFESATVNEQKLKKGKTNTIKVVLMPVRATN
jgi:hypothetical protein